MPDLHRGGKHAIHSISKAEFEQYWGISIEDEIRKLRERYEQEIKSGDQKSAENGLFDGEPPKTLWR
jgi:hypothetical protein